MLADGGVRCWGAGVLWLGSEDDIGDDESILDVSAIPLEEAAERVALGASHTCALTRDGGVRCWVIRAAPPSGRDRSSST